MTLDKNFHDFVINDLLASVSGISSRTMFGGYGIYKHGVIFAIIAGGRLYFKVDDTNRSDFEEYDSQPFVYSQGKHRSTTMSYWELPADIMESSDLLNEWIEKSYQVSLKKKRKNM